MNIQLLDEEKGALFVIGLVILCVASAIAITWALT